MSTSEGWVELESHVGLCTDPIMLRRRQRYIEHRYPAEWILNGNHVGRLMVAPYRL